MNTRRAIILFLRDEREEGLLKPLPLECVAGGYRQLNRTIAERLIASTDPSTDLVVVGTAPVKGLATLPQKGTNFSERITNAFRDTFALGYQQAVMVGNDCPTIAPNEIAAAFAALDQGFAVSAAPARDGGAYIIGLAAGRVNFTEFAALPWQTEVLFAGLLQLPEAVSVGPVRADFDTWRTAAARRALRQFIGFTNGALTPSPIQPYSRSPHSMWMALARPHLPAPPSHRR